MGILLSSLLVVLSKLDILLWLEQPDIDMLGPGLLPLLPLCDKDCSAFSKALLISLTLTARRLFLQKVKINECFNGPRHE